MITVAGNAEQFAGPFEKHIRRPEEFPGNDLLPLPLKVVIESDGIPPEHHYPVIADANGIGALVSRSDNKASCELITEMSRAYLAYLDLVTLRPMTQVPTAAVLVHFDRSEVRVMFHDGRGWRYVSAFFPYMHPDKPALGWTPIPIPQPQRAGGAITMGTPRVDVCNVQAAMAAPDWTVKDAPFGPQLVLEAGDLSIRVNRSDYTIEVGEIIIVDSAPCHGYHDGAEKARAFCDAVICKLARARNAGWTDEAADLTEGVRR